MSSIGDKVTATLKSKGFDESLKSENETEVDETEPESSREPEVYCLN